MAELLMSRDFTVPCDLTVASLEEAMMKWFRAGYREPPVLLEVSPDDLEIGQLLVAKNEHYNPAICRILDVCRVNSDLKDGDWRITDEE